MNKVNKNDKKEIELVKHYIKDLSFENPQSIIENNADNNNNNNLSVNASFIYKPFNDNFFSLIMKYHCECSSLKNNNNLFILELDYFGFFKKINHELKDETKLTKMGADLIIPFVKLIIEDLSNKGGSIPISLENVDLSVIKD